MEENATEEDRGATMIEKAADDGIDESLAKAEEPKKKNDFEVGMQIQAKYGNGWFPRHGRRHGLLGSAF